MKTNNETEKSWTTIGTVGGRYHYYARALTVRGETLADAIRANWGEIKRHAVCPEVKILACILEAVNPNSTCGGKTFSRLRIESVSTMLPALGMEETERDRILDWVTFAARTEDVTEDVVLIGAAKAKGGA